MPLVPSLFLLSLFLLSLFLLSLFLLSLFLLRSRRSPSLPATCRRTGQRR